MNSANPEFLDDDSDDSSLASNPTRKEEDPHTHGNRDFSLAPSPAPASIGRYKIIRTLGSGGFGTVYLGTDSRLNRQVAIKVSNRVKSNSDESERFLTEARAIAALNHPNIIQIYDADRDERGYFVVMEYVKGTTLALEHQQSTQLPIGRIIPIIKQVVLALGHVHERGMVHRDVKPSNVLIAPDDLVKVSDFGLALTEDSPAWGTKERAGTFRYMAPEQVLGENHRLDGRTDLWAVGVMFYELVCGRSPFTAHDANQLFKKILAGEVRPLRQRRPDLPPMLEYICTRCLSKCMADRYQSAIELHEELVKFETSFAGQSVPSSPLEQADVISNIPSAKIPSASNVSSSRKGEIKIVPKGLRSFDLEDASFFRKLLPGPYDIDDNSPSLLYWLKWIRDEGPNAWNRVGLIYGPSGCGKSSFLKAGLIPLLPPHVTTCYFDFTSTDPIKALRDKLVAVFPECKGKKDLSEMFSTIRRHDSKRTVLLVFDQFEQYLVQAELTLDLEIIQALRQCNGKNLRALVLVRDEFWSHASRCMRLIESPLSDEKNAMNIPLFDRRHASRVLEAFGRAYQVLPESPAPLTESQKEFIDQAIEGLAEDKQVICVRIAIFAELMRGYEWTPQSLTEIGGAEGVAVRFLHDALESKNAPMSRRTYLEPCHELLRAILPDADLELKASSQTKSDWIAAAGLSESAETSEAIEVLVNDLRVITTSSSSSNNQTSYHLTHDYLVRPLRVWLADSDRINWRGRARMKLKELAKSYERTSSPRHLPSTLEWAAIAIAVPSKKRQVNETRLMQRANMQVGMRLTALLLGVGLFGTAIGTAIHRTIAANQSVVEKVDSQLAAALNVESSSLDSTVSELKKTFEIAKARAKGLPPSRNDHEELRRLYVQQVLGLKPSLAEIAKVLPPADRLELALLVRSIEESQQFAELCRQGANASDTRIITHLVYMGLLSGNRDLFLPIKDCQDAKSAGIDFLSFATERIEDFEDESHIGLMLQNLESEKDPNCVYILISLLGLMEKPESVKQIRTSKFILQKMLVRDELVVSSAASWLLNRLGEDVEVPKVDSSLSRDWFVIEPLPNSRIVLGALNDERTTWLSQSEINSELFRLFIEEYETPEMIQGIDKEKFPTSPKLPAGWLNPKDAILFCNWLSSKLEMPAAYHVGETEPVNRDWIHCEISKSEHIYFDPASAGIRIPTSDELFLSARFEVSHLPSLLKSPKLMEWIANFNYGNRDPRVRLTGEGLPNPLGFSDCIGNLSELILDNQEKRFPVWTPSYSNSPPRQQDNLAARSEIDYWSGVRMPQTGLRIAMTKKTTSPKESQNQ